MEPRALSPGHYCALEKKNFSLPAGLLLRAFTAGHQGRVCATAVAEPACRVLAFRTALAVISDE